MSKASDAAKAKFEKNFKSGKMKVNKNEIITPGSVVRGVAKVAAKVAGTKAGVKVSKTVAKKVQSQAVKQNKKTVEKVARMQEKTKAEKIAKNSVKVKPEDSIIRARKNSDSTINTIISKSGGKAKRDASYVETGKPSKVVKIKSK